MLENETLAIVIPAYKRDFLAETLQSLVNQTNQHFHVYIGDDHSPYHLKEVVEPFAQLLPITYVCFPENLGGTDLVAQWKRCLKLLNGEKYFCFFSDDDLMEPHCVEAFYQALEEGKQHHVFHFDIDIIDESGKLLHSCKEYPEELSSSRFFEELYTYRIDARMPEFIFETEHFYRCGGFVEFDLAFRSDNATVMACAAEKGIHTLAAPQAKVRWRDSGQNVSSCRNERYEIRYRKAVATMQFFSWVVDFYAANRLKKPFKRTQRRRLVLSEIMNLYPELDLKGMTRVLRMFRPVRTNLLRFAYYWINLWLKTLKHK